MTQSVSIHILIVWHPTSGVPIAWHDA